MKEASRINFRGYNFRDYLNKPAAQRQNLDGSRSLNYLTIVCILSASVDKLTFFVYFGDGDGDGDSNVLTLEPDDQTASELDSEDAVSLLTVAMESDSTDNILVSSLSILARLHNSLSTQRERSFIS